MEHPCVLHCGLGASAGLGASGESDVVALKCIKLSKALSTAVSR